jgi:hypothetical protein
VSGRGATDALRAAATAATAVDNTSSAAATAVPASTSVTLGAGSATAETSVYAMPVRGAVTAPVWESRSSDPISALMARNDSYRSLGSRFFGLGSALLERFATASSDFSQSVVRPAASTPTDADIPALAAAMQSDLRTQSDNQIGLEIQTASGVTVRLSLGSQDEGMAVKIDVSGGTLSDAERDALTKLAGAFQGAIDGLTAKPPTLALSGLMQFDPAVLSSVDFHASVMLDATRTQTVDFHADSQRRTVSATGPAGTVKVDVDLSTPAILGNARQQAQAIDRYLQQFDAAGTRGKGDAALMALFKDAFAQMHRSDGATASGADLSARLLLNDADHSMLSGLVDFSASIVQTATSTNPMHPEERDTFSYKASQSTTVLGSDPQDRSVQQQQQSHLSASYHKALSPELSLMLTMAKESQFYYYTQIEDDASSTTDIAYRDGVVAKASITQSASQSARVQKYVMGVLADDTTTGAEASRTWDVRDLLRSVDKVTLSKDAEDLRRRTQALSQIEGLRLLQANPAALKLQGSPTPA